MNRLLLKKITLLFLMGFSLGLLVMTLSWAETPAQTKKHHHSAKKIHPHAVHKTVAHKKKAHHTAVAHASKPKKHIVHVAAHHPIHKPASVPTMSYAHPDGFYDLHYPASWRLNATDSAMLLHSKGDNFNRAVFGIVRRPDSEPNDEAVSREFTAKDRPADLTQLSTSLRGLPAIKVAGSNKDNPSNRMVEYYVQSFSGHQYYILMMAPRDQWRRYNVSFNAMLRSLSLN